MDNFEQAVRAMLKGKAGDMPDGYDADPALTARVARRRTMKWTSAIASAVVVVLSVGATLATAVNGRKRTEVQTTPTTNWVTVPTVGCPTVDPQGSPRVSPPPTSLTPHAVPSTLANRDQLAFYVNGSKTENQKVLAPRGWQCRVDVSDGGAITFVVAPKLPDVGEAVSGPAIIVLMDYIGPPTPSSHDLQCRTLVVVGDSCSVPKVDAKVETTTSGKKWFWFEHFDSGAAASMSRGTTFNLVRCARVATSTCHDVASDYAQRVLGQTASGSVPGTGCALGTATNPGSYYAPPPKVAARKLSNVDGVTADELGWYVTADLAGQAFSRLAPRGWSCHAHEHGDGGLIDYAVPAASGSALDNWSTAEKYKGDVVRIDEDWLGHGPGVQRACELLAGDASFMSAFGDPWTKGGSVFNCSIKSGRRVTKIANATYEFTDPDGTRGVGTYSIGRPKADVFQMLSCKLTGDLAGLCNTIINDYVSRNPAVIATTPPPTTPTSTTPTTVATPPVIKLDGHIGVLKLGSSSTSDVMGVAGNPAYTSQGNFGVNLPDYNALGYDCTTSQSSGRLPLHVQPQVGGPWCRTIFFLNTKTSTLAAFETSDPKYTTEHGSAAGTTVATAAQREGVANVNGCVSAIILGTPWKNPPGPMGIFLYNGGHSTDRITYVAAEWHANQVGLTAC